MVGAVAYLIEVLDTNTSLEERDCASITNCIRQIVQGASVEFATAVSSPASRDSNAVASSAQLDFDQFHADVVAKTNLVNTLSSIIKMDQYTITNVQSDQQSADGIAISAGLVMKIYAIEILQNLCLNVHNGSMLCNQLLVTANDEFGLIAYFEMVFHNFNQYVNWPD